MRFTLFGRKKRRRERAYEEYVRFHSDAATRGMSTLLVVNPYQFAKRGTKAIVQLSYAAQQQDSWLLGRWPEADTIMAVNGTVGWGPHNFRPDVLYVSFEGVDAILPPLTVQRAMKHMERMERDAHRV